jgi:hypothetical protein
VSFVQGFKKDAQKYGVRPETKNVFELINELKVSNLPLEISRLADL